MQKGFIFMLLLSITSFDTIGSAHKKNALPKTYSIETVVVAFAMSIAVIVAHNVSWHKTYYDQSDSWNQQLKIALAGAVQNSLDKETVVFSLFDEKTRQEMVQLELHLRLSYDNWLAFWNWTSSQKIAYNRMQFLVMFALYSPLMLKVKDQTISVQDIVEQAHKIHGSLHLKGALVRYAADLKRHIRFIHNLDKVIIDEVEIKSLLESMVFYLELFEIMLHENEDYIFEKRFLDSCQDIANSLDRYLS